jgi:hypothetical protein
MKLDAVRDYQPLQVPWRKGHVMAYPLSMRWTCEYRLHSRCRRQAAYGLKWIEIGPNRDYRIARHFCREHAWRKAESLVHPNVSQ